MPDETFHIQKRDRFRKTAEQLRTAGSPDSADANVQDYFYAALHDLDRFIYRLASVNGLSQSYRHGGTHRHREGLLFKKKIIIHRGRLRINDPSHFRRRRIQTCDVIEHSTELYYYNLKAMRQLKVYGELPRSVPVPIWVGGSGFADALDVGTARQLFLDLVRSLRRRESYFHRRGFL